MPLLEAQVRKFPFSVGGEARSKTLHSIENFVFFMVFNPYR